MRLILSAVLILILMHFGNPTQAQDTSVTFAGRIWTETLMQDFMSKHAEMDSSYRNSLITTEWKLAPCETTPFKSVELETRTCLDGPIYQSNESCQFKQYILAAVNQNEEVFTLGRFSLSSRCGLFAHNVRQDAAYIKYPLQFIRQFEDAGDARLVGNAHVLDFKSDGKPCIGFRDYGDVGFNKVYTFTSTGHVCRKTDAAFTANDMKQIVAALRPTTNF